MIIKFTYMWAMNNISNLSSLRTQLQLVNSQLAVGNLDAQTRQALLDNRSNLIASIEKILGFVNNQLDGRDRARMPPLRPRR